MSTGWEAIRAHVQTIWPDMVPVISVWSANGDAAYGVDTLFWSDSSSTHLTPKALNGLWLFQPSDSVAGDRERRIGGNSGNGLDLSNGRIYPTVAFGNAPVLGEQYEVWSVQPSIVFRILTNNTLARFRVPTYGPLITGGDEDMEDTGVSAFTTTSGNALTKVTTASNVDTGSQSLFQDADGAADEVESSHYRVTPGKTYVVSSSYRVDVGGPVAFVIWDETNDVEIDAANRVSHSFEDFMVTPRTFKAPATCEEVSLRWISTGASDDFYIDRFFPPRESVIKAPSWLTRRVDLSQLLTARYRDQVEGDAGTVYLSRSRIFDREGTLRNGIDYDVQVNPAHANPFEVTLRRQRDAEIWFEGLRTASGLYTLANTAAGETSPALELDEHLVTLDLCVRLAQYAQSIDPDDAGAQKIQAEYGTPGEPRGEYAAIKIDYAEDLQGVQPVAYQPANTRWSV
jgi:hypothetical protein